MAMDLATAVRRGVRRMKGGGAATVRWALRDGPTESAREERGDGGNGGGERVEATGVKRETAMARKWSRQGVTGVRSSESEERRE
ncbi:hypothetical protein Syun_006848 [Stephania yunnanensis]|uniref:Uncharacterized protein n=1 Tax=Stephania yunnanensis TaxID=152371 RepID=A0AAP0PXX9_9MAGN